MLTRSVRTIGTCSLLEMSFFALYHVPPVLLMEVGSWTLDTRTLDNKNPAQDTFPSINSATREPKITNASDANLSFKEGDQNALVIIKLCAPVDDAMEMIGAQKTFTRINPKRNDTHIGVFRMKHKDESTRNATIRTSEPSE